MNNKINAIDARFASLKEKGEKALITYIVAGDPDLTTTEKLVLAMEQAGADLIEIGVPFSDPVAERPVIAEASVRALSNPDVTMGNIFAMMKRLSNVCKIPLLLMLYANTAYAYGSAKFFADCADCGISGAIVPDVPFEEREEFLSFAQTNGVHLINLVAPASEERVGMIAAASGGFLYCVPSIGVNGMGGKLFTDFDTMYQCIHAASSVPAVIGFDVSTSEHIRKLLPFCDGLIVGSAIVQLIGEHGKECLPAVSGFVGSLKEACRGA